MNVVGTGRFSAGCVPGAGAVLRQSCCASNSGGVGSDEFHVGVGVFGAARDVVDDLFAGDGVDDDALIFGEYLLADLFDRGDGRVLVAGDVFGQIAGVSRYWL